MRQILISKQNTWKLNQWEPFSSRFLCFSSMNHTDKIPFRLLFHMHDASKLVYHYLHQFIVIMHILREVFGVEHYHLTLDNLFIRKTDYNKTFMLVMDPSHPFLLHCPYGYHIFISGFEECLIGNAPHSLLFHTLPKRWSSFRLICRSICRELTDVSKEFKHLSSHLTNRKIPLVGTEDHTDVLLRLFPLVHVNATHPMAKEITDKKTIQKEIQKMFAIFYKEYELFRSKFTKMVYFHQLVDDWVDILVMYKSDFFKDPDVTVALLRKILYQYMIDHHYSHVSFKAFDLPRMLVSLYVWSQWYEKWLLAIDMFRDRSQDDLKMIGCLETFLETDDFEEMSSVEVLDFQNRKCRTHAVVGKDINDRMQQTHPMLRPGYLYDNL